MTEQEREDMAADAFYDSWHVQRFTCPRCGHREGFPVQAPHGVFECRKCNWPGKDFRSQEERREMALVQGICGGNMRDLRKAGGGPGAMKDAVKEPGHYARFPIQPLDFIKAVLTPEEFRGFVKGNVIAYVSRAGFKDGEPLERDFEKSIFYLRFFLGDDPRKEG